MFAFCIPNGFSEAKISVRNRLPFRIAASCGGAARPKQASGMARSRTKMVMAWGSFLMAGLIPDTLNL
jgi:hypothetical protein